MCQLSGALLLALYHRFTVTSLLVFLVFFAFYFSALHYGIYWFFVYAWSMITVSDLHICIFIIFKLAVFTLIYLWLLQG